MDEKHPYAGECPQPLKADGERILRDVAASRQLGLQLMTRGIPGRYPQFVLGCLWALILASIVASMTLVMDAKLVAIGGTDLPCPAYVMLNLTLWQAFRDALNAPIRDVQ